MRGKRRSDAGFDVIEAALPALASITQTPYEPRYPTLPNIMKAKKKELATWRWPISASEPSRSAWARPHRRHRQRAPANPAPDRGLKPASGDDAAKLIADFLDDASYLSLDFGF